MFIIVLELQRCVSNYLSIPGAVHLQNLFSDRKWPSYIVLRTSSIKDNLSEPTISGNAIV
eukprot:4003358-Amphidinium_carterae.3